MKKTLFAMLGLAALLAFAAPVLAQTQESPPDRVTVPLSDPSKPARIEATVMRGSITVRGYQGKDVIVEARVREKPLGKSTGLAGAYTALATAMARQARPVIATPEPGAANLGRLYFGRPDKKDDEEREKKSAGMKKISGLAATGLEVEEEGNVVDINTRAWKYATDLVIQVPSASSLELGSTGDGEIVVENVSGEIEVNNSNGPVALRNVSGTAVIHAVNGDIEVALSRIADKPMSFSTMNGDVDVTLPADVKASLKMKTQTGEIFSDFDVALTRAPQKVEDSKSDRGKFRISFESAIYGAINGGGPEISLNTFSGDIYIRKKK
ncbi:MAG: DUF4097 domain-containing protein [Candidatus Aminicenantes bacterium]|nr:DUF4097 domain-containing protein [Candidatus Aminicenantes bacterium]